MKLLQINSVCGYGSTGKITTDIAEFIEHNGSEAYIAYGQKNSDYAKSYKIGTRFENHLHNLGSRILGTQGHFSKNGTKKLISYIDELNPSLIHLHNIHGNYLNVPAFFEFLLKVNKPVIWTLHDCWAFTGKCAHYTDVGCYKWKIECRSCPQVRSYPPSLILDRSNMLFHEKQKLFTSLPNLEIITVSRWLENQVRSSFFKEKSIRMIYNWIDTDTFKPCTSINSKYLSNYSFNIVCVGAYWDVDSSKFKKLIKLSKLIGKDARILLVGRVGPGNLPENILHIPYVSNQHELAQIYSYADAYVHLSTEDTFGKVIAEAMACGTPAVVFNSTACPELIGDGCGYVIDNLEVSDVYKALLQIRHNGKSKYSSSCMKHVAENFERNKNLEATWKLYNSMLS